MIHNHNNDLTATQFHTSSDTCWCTPIKFTTVIPGMVVNHDLKITIIKLYGNWNLQQNDTYIKGFNTLREAKAYTNEFYTTLTSPKKEAYSNGI